MNRPQDSDAPNEPFLHRVARDPGDPGLFPDDVVELHAGGQTRRARRALMRHARVERDVSRGGAEPVWSRSGRSLCYRGLLGEVVEVRVTTGAGVSIGERKVVLSVDYLTDSSHPNYDVSPDDRLLMPDARGPSHRPSWCTTWAGSCARRRRPGDRTSRRKRLR